MSKYWYELVDVDRTNHSYTPGGHLCSDVRELLAAMDDRGFELVTIDSPVGNVDRIFIFRQPIE